MIVTTVQFFENICIRDQQSAVRTPDLKLSGDDVAKRFYSNATISYQKSKNCAQ